MKTKDWLKKLPYPFNEMAIAQCKYPNVCQDTLRDAVLSFSDWDNTEEGFDFWWAIETELYDRELTNTK